LESKTKTTQLISLNNAMNPAVQFLMYKERENRLIFKPFILSFTKLYRFLRRKPLDHTDVLREYFIPLNSFNEFINQMRVIFKENKVNLINITFRYVPKGEKVVLDYLKEDCIALVLNLNIGRAKAEMIKAQLWTKLLAQICLNLDGSFYLPYQPWETRLQVKAFYDIEFFKLLKNKYDVAGMFSNEYFKVMF
jgi:decaprenylphospho-beta-D-ribofuranose 2-oxidase